MNHVLDFLLRHGISVLFAAVFVEQMGLPLPAAPWLLAAGALAGSGRMNWFAALGVAALGSLLADFIWFNLGRYGGSRILRLLCKISLEPDSCVRRTQSLFVRYGMKGVVFAKFIPGLNTVLPPLAGSSGASAARFLFFDALGALLYVTCYMLVGFFFSHQLEQVINALASLGGGALVVVAGLIALYLGYKFYQRQKLLRELRTARITVDELHKQQQDGGKPLIFDLRPLAELEHDPAMITGARHTTLDEMEKQASGIPQDRDVILYCSCPNEVSSARLALELHRRGIKRVRPLQGGIDAWRKRNYPTEVWAIGGTGNVEISFVAQEQKA